MMEPSLRVSPYTVYHTENLSWFIYEAKSRLCSKYLVLMTASFPLGTGVPNETLARWHCPLAEDIVPMVCNLSKYYFLNPGLLLVCLRLHPALEQHFCALEHCVLVRGLAPQVERIFRLHLQILHVWLIRTILIQGILFSSGVFSFLRNFSVSPLEALQHACCQWLIWLRMGSLCVVLPFHLIHLRALQDNPT